MYTFCLLTNTFPLDDARPIIVPQEYIQPIEIAILENIHNIKFNHNFYKLIQNYNYDPSAITKELNIIRALEFFCPLLRTKNVIRMLAKLLVTSDIIKTDLPH